MNMRLKQAPVNTLTITDEPLQPKTRASYDNRLETGRQNRHGDGTKFFEVQQREKQPHS